MSIAALLARRNAAYEHALPAARRIVDGVRKGGDARSPPLCREVRRQYATAAVTNPAERNAGGLEVGRSRLQKGSGTRRQEHPRLRRTAKAKGLELLSSQRPDRRPAIRPICNSRLLRSQRTLSSAVNSADDRDPGAGRGRRAHRRRLPKPAPETLAAAALLGITEFYRIGGAHAIAALAYGTNSIPRVDKIVGPGNALRHRGEKSGRLRLRHRHARRPHRDRRHQRKRRPGRNRLRPRRSGRARP